GHPDTRPGEAGDAAAAQCCGPYPPRGWLGLPQGAHRGGRAGDGGRRRRAAGAGHLRRAKRAGPLLQGDRGERALALRVRRLPVTGRLPPRRSSGGGGAAGRNGL
ncbi:MAG: hypothetical protein AVDCRST_MAG77-2679, partial [uncultured Chloroflexi bacterium]